MSPDRRTDDALPTSQTRHQERAIERQLREDASRGTERTDWQRVRRSAARRSFAGQRVSDDPHQTMRQRERGSFMSADEYGRTLAGLSLNLIVRDVARSVPFYTEVLGFQTLHETADYAALERDGATIQLHADRTYTRQPWAPRLADAGKRGFGVEIRLLGIDPDEAERRARAGGHTVLAPAKDWPPHGWRDCLIEDPDGYTFSVGVPLRT